MSRITINSNVASLSARRRLTSSTQQLEKSYQRLSSGLRINRSADDAAGLAIASALNADGKVFHQGVRNFNDGLSLLNIAEGALEELSNVATRVQELAEQSANGTLSLTQRQALNREANALINEYNRIIRSTKFNDRNLLDGSVSNLVMQGGYGTNGQISLSLGEALGRAAANGTYKAEQILDFDEDTSGLAVGDVNGDNTTDYLISDASTGEISVSYTDVNGAISGTTVISPGFNPRQMLVDDFDGDGINEIAVQNVDDPTSVGILKRSSLTSSFSLSQTLTVAGTKEFASADINGDGRNELLVVGDNAGTESYLFQANSAGQLTQIQTINVNASEINQDETFDFKDVNGDGFYDLIATAGSITEAFWGQTGGLLSGSTTLANSGGNTAFSDFNNDGLLDFLFSDGMGGLSLKYQTSPGNFGSARQLIYNEDVPSVGDLNSDGYEDLVTYVPNSVPSIRLSNGDGTFAGPTSIQTTGAPLMIGLSLDFNGDGFDDLTDLSFNDLAIRIHIANTGQVNTLAAVNIATKTGAQTVLDDYETVLNKINTERGKIGAVQSRLGTAVSNLQQSIENIKTAESRIVDADVADESAGLVRNRILQQSGALVLAQANSLPELALRLLRSGN